MTYRPELDGLRAVAVLLVLIYHFALLGPVTGGFVGVDVFFVISGYLVTGIILHKQADGTFDLTDFYMRRIRRLMPALIAVSTVTFAVGLVFLMPNQLADLAEQAIAAQLQVSNIYFWQFLDYFGLAAERTFLLHTWSLGVEAQFYVLFPLLLIGVYRFAPRAVVPVLLVVWIVSFALSVWFLASKPIAVFYLFPTRAWELMTGGLIAALPRVVPRAHAVRAACSIGGLGLVVLASVVIDTAKPFPGPWALLPCLGTALVISSCGERPVGLGTFLAWRPVRYLGEVSYSLYLVHWPIVVALAMAMPSGVPWTARMLGTAASVVLAALLYRYVETPFRRPGSHPAARKPSFVLTRYGIVGGASVAACVLALVTSGLPQRYSDEVIALAAGSGDVFTEARACEGQVLLAAPCLVGDEDAPVSVVVWGDSHAWASVGAFDALLAARGQRGVMTFASQCPPLVGLSLLKDDGRCARYNQSVLDALEDRPTLSGVERVYLVSIWRQHGEGLLVDVADTAGEIGAIRPLTGAISVDLERTLMAVRRLGLETGLMLPVPTHAGDVPSKLAFAAAWGREPDVASTMADYDRKNEELLDAVTANRALIDDLLTPALGFCDPVCAVADGGRPYYADSNHLSRVGAAALGDYFVGLEDVR